MHTMTQIQLDSAGRDVIVSFRICVPLGLLTTPTIPEMILVYIYISKSYLS